MRLVFAILLCVSAAGCFGSPTTVSDEGTTTVKVRGGAAKTQKLLEGYALKANAYKQKHGRMPGSASEWEQAAGGELRDAWGNLVVVEAGALVSLGADGEPGGAGDSKDLRRKL